MLWRLLRTILLLIIGAFAGFMGAAAMLRFVLPSRGDETSDELALVGNFRGIEIRSQSRAFHGGSIITWFGGVSLDRREATLAPGARLDIGTAFGGCAIRVPANWRVETEAKAVAGGVASPSSQPDDPDAPVLQVHTLSIFGGVAINR